LLEILLTTVLSATLLAVLWGLFGIYEKLFDEGQRKASQTQLVRSLMQQLTDDLHSAIEDAPMDDPSEELSEFFGQQTSVRRFGLLGTRTTLRIDVLQVVPLDEGPMLDADVTGSSRDVSALQVPELRTVYYEFTEPGAAGEDALGAPDTPMARRGLTRYELDFETPYDDAFSWPLGADGSDGTGSLDAPASVSSEQAGEALPADDSIIRVPEVVGIEFRYFDGNGWSSQWDSLQRQSLPVAVEVTMRVKPFAEEDSADEDDRESVEADSVDVAVSQLPAHRLVIDLPCSSKHAAVRRPVVADRSSSVRLPAPINVPRLQVPGTSADRAFASPDRGVRWIRVEP